MKYLILNADDFGWTDEISRGIIESHQKGVLTSATVLIALVSSETIKSVKKLPNLGLGLHLNIATDKASSKVWIEKYGEDFGQPKRSNPNSNYTQTDWDNYYGKYDSELVEEEFEAQLGLFRTKFEKSPDHIDTHYNTYSVRSVFEAFKKVAKKNDLAVRQPVRFLEKENVDIFKNNTSEFVSAPNYLKEIKEIGIKTTDYYSPEYMNLHENYVSAFRTELDKISDGQSMEISFHPGYGVSWREKYIKILKDPKLRDLFKENNVVLTTYANLA